jgi:DnaJ-class molecular chaperone
MKRLYEVLGVSPSASDKDIKAAYRRLAKQHHPDLHPGDVAAESKFKDISAAFAILGDPDKRKRYDAGEIDESGQEMPEREFYRQHAGGPGGGRYQTWQEFHGDPDLSSVFEDLFGFGRGGGGAGGFAGGRRQAMRGADVTYTLEIDFLTAARGGRQTVALPDGEKLAVTIPAGSEDGQRLRLKGKGMPGPGGAPAGDAFVDLHVRPHPHFRREGKDIHIDVPITLDEAVLGGKIEVPTIDGPVSMTVPKGAKSGQTLRLKGRGAGADQARGNQLVHLTIAMPPEVDEELEAFMRDWRQRHAYDPRRAMKPTERA